MLAAVVIGVLTAAPCVPSTDVCAPEGSTLTNMPGGRVTLTTSKAWRALGVDFAPGTTRVSVTPFGSTGAVVRLDGPLARPQRVSGVVVEGDVGIAQRQGAGLTAPVVLVRGTLTEAGRLELSGFPPVALEPGSSVNGHLDPSGPGLELDSRGPVQVDGVGFGVGTLRLATRNGAPEVTGTLQGRQRVAGAEAVGFVRLELSVDGGAPQLRDGTLAAAAPLSALVPLEGVLPAGASFTTMGGQVLVRTNEPIEVVGRRFLGQPTADVRVWRVSVVAPNQLKVGGWATDAGVSVTDGVTLEGWVDLSFVRGQREVVFAWGLLRGPGRYEGLRLAAKTPFTASRDTGFIKATLAEPQPVGDVWAKGEVELQALDGGIVAAHATLARPLPFEGWVLPTGTTLQRGAWGWAFTTPKATPARRSPGSTRDVDFVLEARRDAQGLVVTSSKPWRPKGVPFSFSGTVQETTAGCLVGQAPRATIGPFVLPQRGNLWWCNGRVVQAQGDFAVPTLGVGRWFATHAVAGEPSSQPPQRQDVFRLVPSGVAASGYWIQVDRLCHRPAGIPRPPPPERWVFVDARGEPTTKADGELLERLARRPGKPCEPVRCCVP